MKGHTDATRGKRRFRIDEYVAWFIVNVIVCGMPIIATFKFSYETFTNETVGFSSLLSYCFTVVAVGLYLFINRFLVTGDEEIRLPKSHIFFGIACVLAAIGVFFWYNLDASFNKWLNDIIFVAVPVIAVATLFVAWRLTKPLLQKQAEEFLEFRRKMSNKRETERWGKETTREMEEKGVE